MLDTRNRFFAQYWGVKCMYVGGVGLVVVGNGGWNLKHPDFFLELKPLKRLSNDDVKVIGEELNIQYEDVMDILISDKFLEMMVGLRTNKNCKISIIDFLRSKGYAVPFMNYSVKDLVELGWVKLNEK